MPGSVSRYPDGLLSLIEGKTNGQTPRQSEDMLRFGLDMERYYLSGTGVRLEVESFATGAAPLLGNYAEIPIPAGQTWLVLGVTAFWTYANAGDAAFCQPAMTAINEPVSLSLGSFVMGDLPHFSYIAAVAGERKGTCQMLPYPIVAKPPVSFACQLVRSALVAGIGLETQVLHYRLD